jgi:hypothetical protein
VRSEVNDVKAVLEDLIGQFSDPHAFFRELIQNSIDAGSGEVEIGFDFNEPEPNEEQGTLTIHVNDFGEGMNREIIETRLTRLFSSTKDDDLTKIGKFGIGFVSVYAIQPDAIAVDTARGGECWRVVFKPDRTFELYSVPNPVEGTRIRIFKRMTRKESEEFIARANDFISRWCAHVAIPIYVSGEDIRRPFDVGSPIKMEHNEPGTRIIAGLVDHDEAPFGFYNQGLTLADGTESAWPGLTFRIDSKYLEHTLTRDRVLEDKNFHKAKALIDRLYREDLPERLISRMEELARLGPSDEYKKLVDVFVKLVHSQPDAVAKFSNRKIFMDKNGPVSSGSLRSSPIFVLGSARHLARFASNYVHGANADSLVSALDTCGVQASLLHETIILPCDKAELKPQFKRSILDLATRMKFRVKDIFWGDFVYDSSPINFEMVFYLRENEEYVFADAVADREGAHPGTFTVFYLNSRETFLRDLEVLAESKPAFAAMTFLKALLLPVGMSLDEEDRLMRAALEVQDLGTS